MFLRPVYQIISARLKEPRRFLQVLSGPRQTGKTTLIRQDMESLTIPSHYTSADEPTLQYRAWIDQQAGYSNRNVSCWSEETAFFLRSFSRIQGKNGLISRREKEIKTATLSCFCL